MSDTKNGHIYKDRSNERRQRTETTVRNLNFLGYNDGQIAAHLGCTRRTVLRVRSRLDIAPVNPGGANQFTPSIVQAPSRPLKRG